MSIKIIGNSLPNIPWEEKNSANDGLPLWRYSKNPIVGWNPTPSTARIFNSAVLPYKDGFIGVFRADSKHINPALHVGHSNDGIKWEFDDMPIAWVDEDGNPYNHEIHSYDPRLVEIDGRYYIIWCVDFAGCPTIGLGYTDDFKRFVRLENPFIPFNRNGTLFPRRVNNKYLMLSRPSDSGHTPFGDIFLSESPDLKYWGNHRLVMKSGLNWWQGTKIGAGPAPIETDKGWLMLYHGVITNCNGYVYSIGAALLDIDNPAKVLLRTEDYILTPQENYETTAYVPNVCFPCAVLTDAPTGRMAIYYGAADTYTALAFTTADELYEYMLAHNKLGDKDAEATK